MQTEKLRAQAKSEGYHKKTRKKTGNDTPKNGEKVQAPINSPKDIEFPYEVISGVAGDYVNLMDNVIEAPKQFTYMSFVTCIGTLFANRLTLDTFHKPQPRFFTVLIGPSGGSRKSTTIKATIEIINNGLAHNNKINICYGIGSDIGLLKKLNSSDNILLNLDEFKQLTAKSSIKGNNLLPCISTLFDSNRYENQTKTDSIVIDNGYLSILAASTPETYESTWEQEFTNIGLNNRLFVVPGNGKRLPALPPALPPEKIHAIHKGIGRMFNLVRSGLTMKMSDHANRFYADWYHSLEQSVYSQRLEAYCLRFMPLLAINDEKTEIDVEIVTKATHLCDWQLLMRKLHDPIKADTKTAVMEEKIRRQLENRGAMSKRELRQYTNVKKAGLFIFEQAIRNLQKAQEVKFNKDKNKYEFIPE